MPSSLNSWVYCVFKCRAERCGIRLSQNDISIIESCFAKIPKNKHKEVMGDYLEMCNSIGMDGEEAINWANKYIIDLSS